jgi:hypothetical protein
MESLLIASVYLGNINLATVFNAFALTLFFYAVGFKPSPRTGEGLPIRLPFSQNGRRGWGMKANL